MVRDIPLTWVALFIVVIHDVFQVWRFIPPPARQSCHCRGRFGGFGVCDPLAGGRGGMVADRGGTGSRGPCPDASDTRGISD